MLISVYFSYVYITQSLAVSQIMYNNNGMTYLFALFYYYFSSYYFSFILLLRNIVKMNNCKDEYDQWLSYPKA